MTCRICLDEGDLISPCLCTGTAAYVHEECLLKWLNMSGRTDCEIANMNINMKRWRSLNVSLARIGTVVAVVP